MINSTPKSRVHLTEERFPMHRDAGVEKAVDYTVSTNLPLTNGGFFL
jgi:hypothetical protein